MAKKDEWLHTKWRPMMGWTYMVTCVTDFIIFPVLWSILQARDGGQVTSQWAPLTLQGAGLYHLAMGAVIGVAAWSRGQEKMAGVSTFNSPPYISRNIASYGDYDRTYNNDYFNPLGQPRTFVSKHGKVGPIIEEPEL